MKKRVGDREVLRYRRWDRGRSRRYVWQMDVQWKELLAWAATGKDNQVEDSQDTELDSYFLGDKEIFDGRGNVESCHLGGGLLEEWTGAADRADVWDPGGTHDMDQSDELDPGGVHDAGRSGEEDPG